MYDLIMMTKDLKQAGKNIRAAREAKSMTQAETAKRCRITTNYYARIERGECQFTLTILKKLVKVLDLSASQILSF